MLDNCISKYNLLFSSLILSVISKVLMVTTTILIFKLLSDCYMIFLVWICWYFLGTMLIFIIGSKIRPHNTSHKILAAHGFIFICNIGQNAMFIIFYGLFSPDTGNRCFNYDDREKDVPLSVFIGVGFYLLVLEFGAFLSLLYNIYKYSNTNNELNDIKNI